MKSVKVTSEIDDAVQALLDISCGAEQIAKAITPKAHPGYIHREKFERGLTGAVLDLSESMMHIALSLDRVADAIRSNQ